MSSIDSGRLSWVRHGSTSLPVRRRLSISDLDPSPLKAVAPHDSKAEVSALQSKSELSSSQSKAELSASQSQAEFSTSQSKAELSSSQSGRPSGPSSMPLPATTSEGGLRAAAGHLHLPSRSLAMSTDDSGGADARRGRDADFISSLKEERGAGALGGKGKRGAGRPVSAPSSGPWGGSGGGSGVDMTDMREVEKQLELLAR
eukprot:2647512-Rhodomonas_salina.3